MPDFSLRRRTPGGLALTRLLPLLNRGPGLSARRFDAPRELVPHTAGRTYSWSHNGVMIPDLPDPLRFLSMTTVNGAPGAPIADILHRPAPPGGPRNRATLNVTTAATAFWGDYRLDTDCTLAPDGSLWRFGDDVTIAGAYPSYTLTSRTPGLEIDLALEATDIVTWFVHTPVYRHLSLLTHYSGTITHAGVEHQVAGTCAFEHARAVGPYNLVRRPVHHPWLRLPLDFFTYQIVDLEDGRQLLLAHVEAEGSAAMTGAFLRDEDGHSTALVKGVGFRVTEPAPEPATTPDGASMVLPRRFVWTTEPGAPLDLHLEGLVDAPFSWGLASGYVGAYSYSGTLDGRSIGGRRGYVEYIDRR